MLIVHLADSVRTLPFSVLARPPPSVSLKTLPKIGSSTVFLFGRSRSSINYSDRPRSNSSTHFLDNSSFFLLRGRISTPKVDSVERNAHFVRGSPSRPWFPKSYGALSPVADPFCSREKEWSVPCICKPSKAFR